MKKILVVVYLLSLLIWNCAGLKPKPVYTSGSENKQNTSSEEKTVTDISKPVRNNSTNFNREKLIGEIEDLLGVPYRMGGTSPKGMDCSGFVNYVYKNSFNKNLPRRVSELYQTGVSVSQNELRFGDLIFFNNIRSPEISHVGIYLDANQFAHASESQGVIISSLTESYYNERFAGARRVIH